MPALYLLYESASGYALLEAHGLDAIGGSTPAVQESVTDLDRFGKVVKLVAFRPFASAADALAQANALSEAAATPELVAFLESSLPGAGGGGDSKDKKKKKSSSSSASYEVGVADPKLGSALGEAAGVKCAANELTSELLRGVRIHASRLLKGPISDEADATRARLGLAHAYSRAKVKFNVNRVDNMIIQAIALLDTLDKDVNTFVMRVREWYGWHFPELAKVVPDNYQYARVALVVKDKAATTALVSGSGDDDDDDDDDGGGGGGDRKKSKKSKSKSSSSSGSAAEIKEQLVDALGGGDDAAARAEEVLAAARSSMGQDISPIDLVNIDAFARRVIALAEYRAALGTYLREKMHAVAPNLSALIGETVGARLISHAGSLVNLAKYPASTVQILGAEKALFRALKTKGNTPKYGLIFHSSFIGRAKAKNKGRISRYLANKASIASRIDCFSDAVTDAFGERMREQVEERLRFYDDGAATTKNSTAMAEAAKRAGVGSGGGGGGGSSEKKDKKDKKEKKKEDKKKESSKEEKKEKKKRKSDGGDDDGEKKKKKKKK